MIFFAAASNSGANQREYFPARHDSVISIRATSSTGTTAYFNPPLNPCEKIALATLGVDVPSQSLSTGEKPAVMTGTSISTAISSGVAGMLISYVNRHSNRPSYTDIKSMLLTKRGMVRTLKSMSTCTFDQQLHYIKPWSLRGDKKSLEGIWSTLEYNLLEHS